MKHKLSLCIITYIMILSKLCDKWGKYISVQDFNVSQNLIFIGLCTCYLKLFILVKRSSCFGTVFPSIIRSSKLYTQQWYMSKSCCIRSFELLMMDGKTIQNM